MTVVQAVRRGVSTAALYLLCAVVLWWVFRVAVVAFVWTAAATLTVPVIVCVLLWVWWKARP